jgi:5-formyltetrahydrofolate cyclo-ligase
VGPSMREKKHSLRAAALAQRSLLSRSESLARSRLIQARVLQFPPYLLRRSVALYNPIQNEVETGAIRDHALVTGKNVFFPRFGPEDSLELIKIGSATEFSSGRFGILEPTGEGRLAGRDQEKLLVFVPGVAFDSRGNRLGRGKGWYDRLIKELGEATLVALAYDFQIVDEVPAEEWDQRVHYVITERNVVDCRSMPVQSSQVS